jgi:tetratricopeptide (TPR) repeat protein
VSAAPPAAPVPFVGRETQLAALVAAVASAGAGGRVVALVAGEPGIGKTRLVAEVAARAAWPARWATCWPDPGAPAYWPWLQLLRALPDGGGAELADLRGLLAEPPGAGQQVAGEGARFRLFDATAAALAAAARREPLLLVLDDLQWADEGSVGLLRFLARDPRLRGVAVLGTYRDSDLDRAATLAGHLDDLVRDGLHLVLGGLSGRDTGALVAALRGSASADATLLHRRTGGNPFFVRELVRLLDLGGESVPTSVRAVVARRLAGLSPVTRDVLAAASVLGADIDPALLAPVSGRSGPEVLAALDEATVARLVRPGEGGGHLAFAHALVREVLHDGLGRAARVALHRRAGEVLRERGEQARLPETAHHVLLGLAGPQDAELAVGYAIRAGAHYRESLAYEQAASWLRTALDLLRAHRPGDPREAGVLLELGEAALAAGDVAGARQSYEQAAGLARRRSDPRLLANAALGLGAGLGGFEVRLFDPAQVELLEEALAALGPEPSRLRAAVLGRLSVALSFLGSEARRRALSEEAVAVARAVGDPATLGYALAGHCDTIPDPDSCERRLDESAEVVRLGLAAGDRRLELLGRRLRVVALLEVGDTGAVDEEVERFALAADRLRQPLYRWYVPLWRGMRALMRGEADAATRHGDEAAELGAQAGSDNAVALTFTQWWVRQRYAGRFAEAGRAMAELLAEYAGPAVSAGPRAVVAIQTGEPERARVLLEQWRANVLPGRVRDSEWLPELAQLAQAAVGAGAREVAGTLYAQLRPYAHRFCVEGIGASCTGSVAWYLALLARFLGRPAEAAAHAEQARAAHRRAGLVGDPPPLAAAPEPEPGREPAPVVTVLAVLPEAALVREGATWAVTYAGRTGRLRDGKGVRDLAVLLGRPEQEVHCLELMGGTDVGSEPGPALDQQARRAYQQRIRDLQEDVDDARAANDPARAERAEAELDALVQQLSEAFGLSGRSRAAGSAAERARSAVGWRLRAALRQVAEVHPELARHLRNSVRTGTWCAYRPESPVAWRVDPHGAAQSGASGA